MIPPLPKTYHVQNRGHFSAGHLPAPPRSPQSQSYSEHNRRQRKRPKGLGAPRLNRTGSNEKHLGLPCRHRLRAWSATSALAPPAFITNPGKVLLSAEDDVGRIARVLRAEVRHRRTRQQLLSPTNCRCLPRELEADVRDSHHSLAQLVQRILRAAPFDPIIPQCENHRAQKRIDEQCRAYRVKQEIIRGHG